MYRHLCCSCTLLLLACGLPHDADDSLKRIRAGGAIRAGAVIDTPWVTDSGSAAGGIEAGVILRLAAELSAPVHWTKGTESSVLAALHKRELDVVVGGLSKDSPWAKKVGFTLPYHTDTATMPKGHERKHVFAVAPGENALLMAVESAIHRHAPALLAGRAP